MVKKKRASTNLRVLYALMIVVGALWAGSLVLDMANPTYDPPETIGLAFMAILSTLLGIVAASNRDGGSKDDENEDEE
ncbi:membrane protein [Gordonia phage Archimedes]|uniref:Membrane protein n=1 Tax=Gordonia phage Archimedes TaxID=2759389 RepID=A0A7L7SHN1_9CAUD|nr:membrane protein [Gordonia phage Archimedes]QOC55721.1 membrane protein [Gordonia phage Archimedes]